MSRELELLSGRPLRLAPRARIRSYRVAHRLPWLLNLEGAGNGAEILGWMVEEKSIQPHVSLWERGERTDGTFSRSDFAFDPASDTYKCPGGKTLQQYRRPFTNQRSGLTKDNTRIYRASQRDCGACALKESCCPGQPRRKIPRSIHEAARDVVRRLAGTPEYRQSRRKRKNRDAVRPSQAHPQTQPAAIVWPQRRKRRVRARSHCS
jgi:hypothetical protein